MISKLLDSALASHSHSQTTVVDLSRTYAFATFDIMGDLLLGSLLSLLESSQFSPWVHAVYDFVKVVAMLQLINTYPLPRKNG